MADYNEIAQNTDYRGIAQRLEEIYNSDNEMPRHQLIHDALGNSIIETRKFYDKVWEPFLQDHNIGDADFPYDVMRGAINRPESRGLFCNIKRGLWCTKEYADRNGIVDCRNNQ